MDAHDAAGWLLNSVRRIRLDLASQNHKLQKISERSDMERWWLMIASTQEAIERASDLLLDIAKKCAEERKP